MKDAGSETISPKKEHTLYKGIYNRMRHPQAVGETSYWWVFSFFLNSPFLVLISFIPMSTEIHQSCINYNPGKINSKI